MKRLLLLLLFLPFLILELTAQQKTPRERSIEISVTTNASPPSITLNWVPNTTPEEIKVYRKVGNTTAPWGAPIAILPSTAITFTDTDIQVGVGYEYGLWKKEHELINWTVCTPTGASLNFTINNTDNNGLCCVYGPGWYEVEACGVVHAAGDEFGSSETTIFTPCSTGGSCTDVNITINPDIFTHQTYWNLTDATTGTNYGTSGPPFTFLTSKPTFGFVYAGIDLPEMEQMGSIMLLVDDTYTIPLASELERLELDLIKEGWKVVRNDVSRTLPVPQVKNIIQQRYTTIPDLKTVFIFGHVAVPYSGNIYPDAHHTHKGAWPADVFYAEMNGIWHFIALTGKISSASS